jgi:hypothetical protein
MSWQQRNFMEAILLLKKRAMFSAILLAGLSACGGGGDDESGSKSEFNVSPTTFTLKANASAPASTCPATSATVRIFVNGGAAPYTVHNSYESWIQVSATTLSKGGSFDVSFLGGCLSPGSVLVKDALGRQIEVTINYEPKD